MDVKPCRGSLRVYTRDQQKPGTGFSDRGLNGSPKLAAYTPALSNRSFSGALKGRFFSGAVSGLDAFSL